MDILRLDLEIFVNKIKKFIEENMSNESSDFVTDIILYSESLFVLACKKIAFYCKLREGIVQLC